MKNNYRVILSIVLAFVLTAFLQDRLPPFSLYMIKVPFVLSAFIYFMFRHNLVVGIIAAVFCAIFGDGLSETCDVAYLITCVSALFVNHYVLKKQLSQNSISCGIIAIPLTILVLLLQYFSISAAGYATQTIGFLIPKLLISSILTCIGTIVISEVIYRFEIIVGNKEVVNEEFN